MSWSIWAATWAPGDGLTAGDEEILDAAASQPEAFDPELAALLAANGELS